ncbi:MAG: acetate--CoA ligase family protein [Acidimicrobiia bacterium]
MALDLAPLLEAKSVAVVGASPKPGSVGHEALHQLRAGGYSGRVVLVNPNHSEIDGLRCESMLVEAVDLAVLAVGNNHLAQQTDQALAAGVRSLAIFASCFGELHTGEPLQTWLAGRLAHLPVVGGNGMGFLNLTRSLRICGFYQPLDLRPGGLTFISHSGSLFSAMLHNHRHLRFNLVVSSGNELTTTASDYLRYALAQPETRAVGMFLETVRDREGLTAAFGEAAERDVPVVVLKVGRSANGAAAVTTHSAGLAGAYEPFAAFARAHGIHLVDSIDEMADTLALFACSRRATTSSLGAVHDSGGEKTLLLDRASELGVELAAISPSTRARLADLLDEGLEPDNPVDAWGTGRAAIDVFAGCLRALSDDEAVGAVALAVDLTSEEDGGPGYAAVAVEVAATIPKPLAVLANLSAAVDHGQAQVLAGAGVPLLQGMDSGLRALRHLLYHRPVTPVRAGIDPLWQSWRDRLGAGAVDEVEALEMIATAGIPVARLHLCRTPEEALATAAWVGYPVALKVMGIAHKTEHGGLRLGLADADEVASAWNQLSPFARPIAVQQMAPPGVEVALGLVNDSQVGPVVMIGAGGVLVELVADRAWGWPPFDEEGSSALLASLRLDRLLKGYRGRAPLAREKVVVAIAGFSRLAVGIGDLVSSLDVNPLIVGPDSLVAVDALVVR